MWGDNHGAASLNHPSSVSDKANVSAKALKCKSSLVQISSPAHIGLHDTRWQELFLTYEILVHLDRDHSYSKKKQNENESLVTQVSKNMARNTKLSSNLAAFTWHVTKMINELIHSCVSINEQKDENLETGMKHTNVTMKIALVGKARVVCGALNLYRIMLHEAMVETLNQRRNEEHTDESLSSLEELLQFDSRLLDNVSLTDTNLARGLIDSLLNIISFSIESKETKKLIYSTPELYDTMIFSLQLLLVLFSSQLYCPIVSSFHRAEHENPNDFCDFFLEMMMRDASKRHGERSIRTDLQKPMWSPNSITKACLFWMINRPRPPERSITHHLNEISEMIAKEVKQEKMGPDGMFETHDIVMANSPNHRKQEHIDGKESDDQSAPNNQSTAVKPYRILDSTKKVMHISSSLLLLPIRLLLVALRALGHSQHLLGNGKGSEDQRLLELQALYGNRPGFGLDGKSSAPSPTNDVLWLTDSLVADLGSSLFLLLTNNHRAGVIIDEKSSEYSNNPFRIELAAMDDNRWQGFNNTPSAMHSNLIPSGIDTFESIDLPADIDTHDSKQNHIISTNFEHLFSALCGTVHTEIGALNLYTLLQASPIFAASLAVRSDLDNIVLPLLRTLYYSCKTTHHISGRTATTSENTTTALVQPFRSRSQLYVIMILLLIFSQDASFGPDSFRRSSIPSILWYKEKALKDVSLGSLLMLSLLRCITFNLNRLQDPFLLSNCCAILLNISPHVVDLDSYTSMRLVSVLIATMKRYTLLVMKHGGKPADDGDVTSTLGMYAEACRILLQLVKHSVRRKVVDKNVHLIHALVFNQRDFYTIVKSKSSPFRPADISKIQAVLEEAMKLIPNATNSNIDKSLAKIKENMDVFKGLRVGVDGKNRKRTMSSNSSYSNDSTISDSTMNGMEDYKFTYEEEADPETFFMPYIWEVIVSTVTSNSVEWNKVKIKAFTILHHAEASSEENENAMTTTEFAENVDDVV